MISVHYLFSLFPPSEVYSVGFGGQPSGSCLIFYFTKTYVRSATKSHATPSWPFYVGIAAVALTYPVVGIREITIRLWLPGFVPFFIPLFTMIWSSPLYQSIIKAKASISLFPFFSSSWFVIPVWSLLDRWYSRFLFLCLTFYWEWSEGFNLLFQPDLSNSYQRLWKKNGPVLL